MDSVPGYRAIKESEESQIWATGPDNQHKRFELKANVKSTVTDSGNTPTTTIRGGSILSLKDSDGMAYLYDPDANDGTQIPVGITNKHLNMLEDGAVADKFTKVTTQGILKSNVLANADKVALSVLLRRGFLTSDIVPNGAPFLIAPLGRYWKAAAYTILNADFGMLLIATAAVDFTLPTLATVGPGFTVWLFQVADANMIVTAAANTIAYDDTAGGKATTLTWSTANQKMGASVMMRSDYDGAAGTLTWFPHLIQRTVVAA